MGRLLLKYRIITTSILIPVVIAMLFLLPPVEFILIILLVCMLGAWEWGQLAGLVFNSQRILFAVLCGLLLVLMMFNVPACCWPFFNVWHVRYALWTAIFWWLTALLLVVCYPRSAALWRNSSIIRLIFGILIILPFFWGMLALRQHYYDSNYLTGAWWLLYIMVIVWGMDSGAYIFGSTLGRHKLAPKLSPEKTWEGLWGGLFTSSVIALIFVKYAPIDVAPIILFICSMIAALASILGDLTESMFKREADIKDSSHLIPGHGGILDRIDSLIAAVPIFACMMLLIFNAI